jgi:hypothetical protein
MRGGGVTFLPGVSTLALKEWAVAVNALSTGRQIMVLRKGGIHRDDKDFRIVHPEFLLFPTYEHQAPELLKEQYQGDLAATLDEDDVEGLVTVSAWTEVAEVIELRDEATLSMLSKYHIWTDDYAQKRLHWRPKYPLTVALLRVYTLQQPQAIPVLDEYIGCKSWVELGQEVPLGQMEPVLGDAEFRERADAIKQTLAEAVLTAQ